MTKNNSPVNTPPVADLPVADSRVVVVRFWGTNREDNLIAACQQVMNITPTVVDHTATNLDHARVIFLPGGFSYGDYLRCGAIASRQPVMRAIKECASRSENPPLVIGICNGFQILLEAGLLEGALLANRCQTFVHQLLPLTVVSPCAHFCYAHEPHQRILIPVANHDGRYVTSPQVCKKMYAHKQILWRYSRDDHAQEHHPVDSDGDIAAIRNVRGNVVGMMPHPEDAITHRKIMLTNDGIRSSIDGRDLFCAISKVIKHYPPASTQSIPTTITLGQPTMSKNSSSPNYSPSA